MSKKICLWRDGDDPLIDYRYYTDYSAATRGFFNCPFDSYHNILYKDKNKDTPSNDNLNLVVLPCASQKILFETMELISDDLYKWCNKNSIKIVFSYLREYPCVITEMAGFKKHIQKCFIDKGYSSRIIKILINGIKNNIEPPFDEYFIVKNMWEHILQYYINVYKITKKDFILNDNRSFNFSLLTGTLDHRPFRAKFLYELFKRNLLDHKFFYTIVCPDLWNTLSYLNTFSTQQEMIFFKKNVKNIAFKESGERLIQGDVYITKEEWKVPVQVLDSYIHIVLETRPESPSITEKLYKPILVGLPFLWHATPNLAPYLISQGYRLYPFIDYSFDKSSCAKTRMIELCKEIERLKNINLPQKIMEFRDISDYNKKRFLSSKPLLFSDECF